jgi:hypothetical protein
MNGKESPKESFEKFTGHMLLKQIRKDEVILKEYATDQKRIGIIYSGKEIL